MSHPSPKLLTLYNQENSKATDSLYSTRTIQLYAFPLDLFHFHFFFLIFWKIKKGVTHPEPAKENLISSQNGALVVPKPTSENVIYLFPGSKEN